MCPATSKVLAIGSGVLLCKLMTQRRIINRHFSITNPEIGVGKVNYRTQSRGADKKPAEAWKTPWLAIHLFPATSSPFTQCDRLVDAYRTQPYLKG